MTLSMDGLLTLAWIGQQLAALGVIAVSSWVFGEAVLCRLRLGGTGSGGSALAAILGLGLVSQAMFLLGVVGLFRRDVVLVLLGLAHLACHDVWRSALPRWRSALRLQPVPHHRRHVAVLLGVCLPVAWLALYPATAFDATLYHLPYVKAFAAAERLVFVPELRFPIFPQAVEMQLLLGWFLGGETGAQWTQVLAYAWTAILVADWGEELGSRRAGLWAAALWLGAPITVWLGGSAYIDLGFAAFVTAAFLAWERWRRLDDGLWLALTGVFVGLAASSKYLGLFFCAVLGVLTLTRSMRRPRSIRPVIILALAAGLTLAPWYLRIVIETGNPVFPFYASVFGDSEWLSYHGQPDWQAQDSSTAGSEPGLVAWAGRQANRIAEGVSFLVLVPWNTIFHRELFRHQSLLTPWYLVLLPLCLPFALANANARRLLAIGGVFALFWLTTARSLRYLVPALPILNLSLAIGIDRLLATRLAKRITGLSQRPAPVLAILFLMVGPAYGIYMIVGHGPLPLTAAAREDYLGRSIKGFRMIHHLNAIHGSDYTVYSLRGENLRYYADGHFLGDWFGPHRFARVQPFLDDAGALHAKLLGFEATHFLVSRRMALTRDAAFEQLFRLELEDEAFLLFELRHPQE